MPGFDEREQFVEGVLHNALGPDSALHLIGKLELAQGFDTVIQPSDRDGEPLFPMARISHSQGPVLHCHTGNALLENQLPDIRACLIS